MVLGRPPWCSNWRPSVGAVQGLGRRGVHARLEKPTCGSGGPVGRATEQACHARRAAPMVHPEGLRMDRSSMVALADCGVRPRPGRFGVVRRWERQDEPLVRTGAPIGE